MSGSARTTHAYGRPTAETVAVSAVPHQRACACGEFAGFSGKCARCSTNERFGIQPKLAIGQPGDRYEEEADRIADQAISDRPASGHDPLSVTPLLQRQADEEEEEELLQPKANSSGKIAPVTGAALSSNLSAAGPGRPLDAGARAYFEPRMGYDLSAVRLHDDARAAAMSQQIRARAFTHRNHIFFDAGELDARSVGGRRLLAHEMAHTLQQSGSAATVRRKKLTDIDVRIRKKIRISRTAPRANSLAGWAKQYFDPKQGTSRNVSGTMEYGSTITDKNEKKGLESLADELIAQSKARITPATKTQPAKRTNTNPENWPLGVNNLLDVVLDLRSYGHDHAIYRFVRYTQGRSERVLVEKKPPPAVAKAALKPAPVKSAAPKPTTGKTAAKSHLGKVTIGNISVEIDSSFGEKRGKIIADAIALLPAPIRAKVDGVKIDYAGLGKGPRGENGHYDQAKDKVKIWADLFKKSSRRVGTSIPSAYQVVHELGHVIDQRPLFKAQNARNAAEKRKKKLESDLLRVDTNPAFKSNDPLGGLSDIKNPKAVAEKARLKKEIAKVKKEIAKHNKAMLSAKPVAGSELGGNTAKLTTAFGKALKADGVKPVKDALKANRAAAKQTPPGKAKDTLSGGITLYAETDLMEAFAENFSYYILDEALLKALRPKTHAFFAKAYPKTTGAKP